MLLNLDFSSLKYHQKRFKAKKMSLVIPAPGAANRNLRSILCPMCMAEFVAGSNTVKIHGVFVHTEAPAFKPSSPKICGTYLSYLGHQYNENSEAVKEEFIVYYPDDQMSQNKDCATGLVRKTTILPLDHMECKDQLEDDMTEKMMVAASVKVECDDCGEKKELEVCVLRPGVQNFSWDKMEYMTTKA
jgi:hypothetical protein